VIDVSSLIVVDELSTPKMITMASYSLVGKFVPTKATSVPEEIVTDETVGEASFSYSN
jgi:hypothetical protein